MPTPAFLEIRFPTNVSLGAIGGQGWSTRVVETNAGYEYRQQLWDRTRGHWTVGHNLRTQQEWDQLITFHRLALGKTFGFRFQDWTDYQDLGRGVVVTNSKGHLQLAKAYETTDLITSEVITSYRLITKPQPGTVTLNPNSVTLDYTSGLVSGAGASIGTTWTGQFDLPVRFDVDQPDISMDLPAAAGWRGIPIIEIRIEDP